MSIELTISVPKDDHSETIKAERAFGIALTTKSESVTEAQVFLVGSMNVKDVLSAVEHLCGAATMIVARQADIPAHIAGLKIAEAVAQGCGEAMRAAKKLEEEEAGGIEDKLEKLAKLLKFSDLLADLEKVVEAEKGGSSDKKSSGDFDDAMRRLAEKLKQRQRS
jgi:hypothetical protein